MDQATLKAEIRVKLLDQKKAVRALTHRRKSEAITERLLTSERFQVAGLIHLYLSNEIEVETTFLFLAARRLKKKVAVPVIDPQTQSLSFSELTSLEADLLEIGPFGIRQPKLQFQKKIELSEIDLWIVPGVAFDSRGNRIGYGGGYYDRALSEVNQPVIGLAFEMQIINQVPLESTDRPVDYIITEERTIYCKEEERGRNNY